MRVLITIVCLFFSYVLNGQDHISNRTISAEDIADPAIGVWAMNEGVSLGFSTASPGIDSVQQAVNNNCKTSDCALMIVSKAHPNSKVYQHFGVVYSVYIHVDRYYKNGLYHVHGGETPGGQIIVEGKEEKLSYGWSGDKPKCPAGDWP